jgi:hypothetical protein
VNAKGSVPSKKIRTHGLRVETTGQTVLILAAYTIAGGMPKHWFHPHAHTHVALDDAIE